MIDDNGTLDTSFLLISLVVFLTVGVIGVVISDQMSSVITASEFAVGDHQDPESILAIQDTFSMVSSIFKVLVIVPIVGILFLFINGFGGHPAPQPSEYSRVTPRQIPVVITQEPLAVDHGRNEIIPDPIEPEEREPLQKSRWQAIDVTEESQ